MSEKIDPDNFEVLNDAEGKAYLKVHRDEKEAVVEKRVADVKEDLKDDGKRNYSHDPKRKSPGRKKLFKK